MPTFRFESNTPEERQRRELINKILPRKTIVSDFLQPRLMEAMHDVLIKALKKEIEIYKAYPKTGKYNPNTFDTRSNDTCFMGQGFQANGLGPEGWYDADLAEYRLAIGTIAHKEWGDCTLLEIWGGDHFKDYPEMVRGVMEYAWGRRKTMPELQFHINPFFKNASSGKMQLSEQQQETTAQAKHLNKVSAYLEIRDRLEKANLKNPLDLAYDEKDDPKGGSRSRLQDRGMEDDDDDYNDEDDY